MRSFCRSLSGGADANHAGDEIAQYEIVPNILLPQAHAL
jgi:hypothetical protein